MTPVRRHRGSGKIEPARVVLYTRRGCHLCEEAGKAIRAVGGAVPLQLETIDIDDYRFLKQSYSEEVPVVWLHGEKLFKFRVEPDVLLRRLGAEKNRTDLSSSIGRRGDGTGDAIPTRRRRTAPWTAGE